MPPTQYSRWYYQDGRYYYRYTYKDIVYTHNWNYTEWSRIAIKDIYLNPNMIVQDEDRRDFMGIVERLVQKYSYKDSFTIDLDS